MGFDIALLWKAPEVNPITKKARSIPILNPINAYGRVFFFSWMGFMLGFWAWYTFPPLLTVTIKQDLNLSAAQIANSNIVSLSATFFLRFIAGPLCDQFGSRRVYASLMLLGCLPIGLAPLVKNATGLYISRFFIGILGATFVPCQVWCTGFFDKNVVGTANALAGGWGNAGGGITYFIMPAVFDSLVSRQGMSASEAWRVTFVVPLICLITCALGMLFLCPDTPVGSWGERPERIEENLRNLGLDGVAVVDIPGTITDCPLDEEKGGASDDDARAFDQKRMVSVSEALELAKGETVVEPSFREALPVIFSLQTFFHVATYSCSFGGELAVNSVLSSYFKVNFPHLDQTKASNYAAIFGFLNFVTRPLGGVIADVLYNKFGRNLWLKKGWITACGVLTGALLIVVGRVNPSEQSGRDIGTMVGLVAVAAIFLEAGNGANFALVPHVHPSANGILSGLTGGAGNLGGVVFAVIFRFMDHGNGYDTAFWVIGAIHIAMHLAVCWIPPLPKGQVGGH
ncbi:Nitrate transporter [Tolypocladium ophioglossoides CBS 100239]|uniref:Nitrate/nitrite transporter n=1 Tax=Tolypocladium ophioglossoides (strain CBS 100239) TaxID=1163406 RepID=A0A0L0NLL1_TOLOC|nr:Nitrate transporter [Tolypocladium ophioglossoides CBS 100239]